MAVTLEGEECVGVEIYNIPGTILRPTLIFLRNIQISVILLSQRKGSVLSYVKHGIA